MRIHSKETRRKISEALFKGEIIKCLVCKKDKKSAPSQKRKYCSPECYAVSRVGKKRPKHSLFMKGRPSPMKGKRLTKEHREKLRGSNSPRWKGGITHLYHKIRRLAEYNRWRLSIFERDNFTCLLCKDNRGGNLNADHIKPFFVIIAENNITNTDIAIKCKELWDIDNGRTLCRECHLKTDTYGKNIYSPVEC